VRQSRFEGSHRQRRAETLRILLAHCDGVELETVWQELSREEMGVGIIGVHIEEVLSILEELQNEGMCQLSDGLWQV